ncbi:MAG: hypothetical protein ACLFUJ_15990 [Phycisphaerae bacterium]
MLSRVVHICLPLLLTFSAATTAGAGKKQAETPTPLSPAGQKLLARYSQQRDSLRSEIAAAVKLVDPKQTEAFVRLYQAEATAIAAELKAMRDQDRSKDKAAAAQAYTQAKQARAEAATRAAPVVEKILQQVQNVLSSDGLDDKLTVCVLLVQAEPERLAAFAQQGPTHQKLIASLLGDPELIKRMLIAGGAKAGRYGRAMEIYTAIEKADPDQADEVLRRLALAISLEHAEPIAQNNPMAQTDAPKTVDPTKRYLQYRQAWQAGQLDPYFGDLKAWEMRMVVHGNEPDWTLAWGRKMLRNYRPDHVYTADDRWRYVNAVRTEVKYGSQDVKNDKPELQQYQNIIANGGVCGRRAFFGRFLLRAFGVPTVRRPQRGHAALTHWTPNGWVINLGAGWGWGWTPFGQDLDFRTHTEARRDAEAFLQVLRARWIAESLGEKPPFGFHDKPEGFWSGVALYRQRQIAQAVQADPHRAKTSGRNRRMPEGGNEKEMIRLSADGRITIPAVACSKPTRSTRKILFMDSSLGGRQLHYARTGKAETFEYTFDAPTAGVYALTARVVTTSDSQHLLVAANGADKPIDIALPYTIGMWKTTGPVLVTLVRGRNVLRFSRDEPVKGLSIKDFTLRPTP